MSFTGLELPVDSIFFVSLGACCLIVFLSVPLVFLCLSASTYFEEKTKFIFNLGRQMFPDRYLTFKEWIQKHRKKK